MPITGDQCRAARALVEMAQEDLMERAKLSRNTILHFEKGRRIPNPANLDAIRRVLEEAGVEFIPQDEKGPGVRLRCPVNERTPDAI
ncbi:MULTISPECIES: helix-turn-helix transcriptional regulator [unclassified Xanthobacter]|nr:MULTISPECIES: helix-turn-helix transcriptional regulator [unclassified Xanthobacter]